MSWGIIGGVDESVVSGGSPDRRERGWDTAAAFAQLALDLHSLDVEETVQAIADFALKAIGCTYAGVVLTVPGDSFEIPAATDPVVAEILELVLATGQGGTPEAIRTGTSVLVTDTAAESRWPAWTAKLRDLGIRSALFVPVRTTTETIGALALYSDLVEAFDRDDEAIAHILARHVSVALATVRREQNLNLAIDARKLVGQAMGILMERHNLDSDTAFAVLRRYSQDTNTKLRDVAQQVIETRRLP